MTINVRGGNATARSDWFWTQIWLELIKTIEHLLPDWTWPLNAMDEPRLVVPWEQMDDYMAVGRREDGQARRQGDRHQRVPDAARPEARKGGR